MFETTFKNLDRALRKDDGCSTELDYIEQTSWVLFLKYLDDYETDRASSAQLAGEKYERLLNEEFSWKNWAAPKNKDGKIDYNKTLTGDDLKDFVAQKLFPYLSSFKRTTENANTLQYKIGEIFSELKNKIQSGYTLREVIDKVDELRFRSNEEKHEMSSLYEDKIKNMGNAGRNGGEYYTPRPLIKKIVEVVNPVIGNKVYDGAVGSAGFLCEAYEFLRHSKELSATEYEQLQTSTLYGKEKKSLAYIIGVMNMILHGIEAPNIVHTNTLAENISDIEEKDKVDIILANPPFGSETEHEQIQHNFPIRSGETAYLFLQHFIKKLRTGGRCGIVIKNTFLTNDDAILLRKQLLEECNLYAILELPKGAFTGTVVKTVVLFFEKGTKTKNIWYYQLNTGRSLTKTNPLTEAELSDFISLEKIKATSENSWSVSINDIDTTTWNLSPVNPAKKNLSVRRFSSEIIEDLAFLNEEFEVSVSAVKELL